MGNADAVTLSGKRALVLLLISGLSFLANSSSTISRSISSVSSIQHPIVRSAKTRINQQQSVNRTGTGRCLEMGKEIPACALGIQTNPPELEVVIQDFFVELAIDKPKATYNPIIIGQSDNEGKKFNWEGQERAHSREGGWRDNALEKWEMPQDVNLLCSGSSN